MSLYPPLTDDNIATLGTAVARLALMRKHVDIFPITLPLAPGDEDELLRDIAGFRRCVAELDAAAFAIFGLVHRLKNSNVPTTLPPTKSRKPTLDDLEGMF